jgi:hypothetical protein
MAGVFQNIDPPSPSPPGECVPPAFGAGEGTLGRRRGGGGPIFWKTSDTILYVLYVSKYFVYKIIKIRTPTGLFLTFN